MLRFDSIYTHFPCSLKAVFVLLLITVAGQAFPFSGGNGTAANPYKISTVQDLLDVNNNVSAHYKMINDIDLSDRTFDRALISPSTAGPGRYYSGQYFRGRFDGDGNKIKNLKIDATITKSSYLGLFGQVGGIFEESVTISNLSLENVTIIAADDAESIGILCGSIQDGIISNCHVSGMISSTETKVWKIGGVCGKGYRNLIKNCSSNISISILNDSSSVGGIAGWQNGSNIQNCSSQVNIAIGGNARSTGGICGYNGGYTSESSIDNCSATGSINWGPSSYFIGGICGVNDWSSITNCHATVVLSDNDPAVYIGGICGENNRANISNCYTKLGIVARQSSSVGGLSGGNFLGTIVDCNSIGNIEGYGTLGGLCGSSTENSLIANCYATGNVLGTTYLGGLCGSAGITSISDCFALGNVTGEYDLGGLCGTAKGKIINCYALGDVNGISSGPGLGGFVGEVFAGGEISNCYATGNITGDLHVYRLGGFVGYNRTDSKIEKCFATGNVMNNGDGYGQGGFCGQNYGELSNCYSLGNATGFLKVGGFTGSNWYGSINKCYAVGTVSGTNKLGGMVGEGNGEYTYSDCFWNESVNPSLLDSASDYDTDANSIDHAGIFAKSDSELKIQSI